MLTPECDRLGCSNASILTVYGIRRIGPFEFALAIVKVAHRLCRSCYLASGAR